MNIAQRLQLGVNSLILTSCFFLVDLACGAGVTIVTHGHQPTTFPPRTGEPEWVLSMAREIALRSGDLKSGVSLYRATVEYADTKLELTGFARIAGTLPTS